MYLKYQALNSYSCKNFWAVPLWHHFAFKPDHIKLPLVPLEHTSLKVTGDPKYFPINLSPPELRIPLLNSRDILGCSSNLHLLLSYWEPIANMTHTPPRQICRGPWASHTKGIIKFISISFNRWGNQGLRSLNCSSHRSWQKSVLAPNLCCFHCSRPSSPADTLKAEPLLIALHTQHAASSRVAEGYCIAGSTEAWTTVSFGLLI